MFQNPRRSRRPGGGLGPTRATHDMVMRRGRPDLECASHSLDLSRTLTPFHRIVDYRLPASPISYSPERGEPFAQTGSADHHGGNPGCRSRRPCRVLCSATCLKGHGLKVRASQMRVNSGQRKDPMEIISHLRMRDHSSFTLSGETADAKQAHLRAQGGDLIQLVRGVYVDAGDDVEATVPVIAVRMRAASIRQPVCPRRAPSSSDRRRTDGCSSADDGTSAPGSARSRSSRTRRPAHPSSGRRRRRRRHWRAAPIEASSPRQRFLEAFRLRSEHASAITERDADADGGTPGRRVRIAGCSRGRNLGPRPGERLVPRG